MPAGGAEVPRPFALDCFDAELERRNTPQEWARIRAFRDRPGFINALFAYADLMPSYYADNVLLNKVVTEAWRFQMLVYTLHLYDTRDPDDPSTGLTVSNLTRICKQQRIASRGRVMAILGIMQIAGYLHRRRSALDSRIVHLEPSAEFVGIVEGWNQRILQIIDTVDDTQLAAAHRTEPRFGWDMRRRGAETLLGGWKVLDPFPEVCEFVYKDGGWMLLITIAARALRPSRGARIDPVTIDLTQFGPRFGVSRSHLRRVLDNAHAKGLLDVPPRNGQKIILAPHLVASYLSCMASELANYQRWALAVDTHPSRRPHPTPAPLQDRSRTPAIPGATQV